MAGSRVRRPHRRLGEYGDQVPTLKVPLNAGGSPYEPYLGTNISSGNVRLEGGIGDPCRVVFTGFSLNQAALFRGEIEHRLRERYPDRVVATQLLSNPNYACFANFTITGLDNPREELQAVLDELAKQYPPIVVEQDEPAKTAKDAGTRSR